MGERQQREPRPGLDAGRGVLDLLRDALTPLLPDDDRNYPKAKAPEFHGGQSVRLNELGCVARPRSVETWGRAGVVQGDPGKTRMVNVRWDGCASVAMVSREHLEAFTPPPAAAPSAGPPARP